MVWLFSLFFLGQVFASDFDVLMGKDEAVWQFLQDKRDVEFLAKCASVYSRQLPRIFEKHEGPVIPRTIHFIWLGPKGFPAESIKNVRSWIAFHPDWKVKFWTDRARPLPCKSMELCDVRNFSLRNLGNCYDEATNWGQKSDILRLEILFQEGGVYVDHDAVCLRPFDSFHAGCEFYAGLEAPHELHGGYGLTVANGLVGAIPNHPIIGRTMDVLATRWASVLPKFYWKKNRSAFLETIARTYLPLTIAVQEMLESDSHQNVVFPTHYFYASDSKNSLYARHQSAASWLDEAPEFAEAAKIGRLEKNHHHLVKWATLAFILSGLLFVTSFSFYFAVKK